MAEAPVVAEGDEMLVRDLGEQHYGWLIEVWNRAGNATAPSATFTLVKIRRWTYQGIDRAGLLDDDRRGPFIGTEHLARDDMRVRVLRRVSKPRRSRRSRATSSPASTDGDQ